jgi:penicillin-binding protein-related factor A (putative recombinase)
MSEIPKRKVQRSKPKADLRAEVAAAKSRASRSGVRGEQVIAEYNACAESYGVALLHKLPTPTRRVKRGNGWSIIYTARSTVDYCGVMLDGTGRHVAIEAKSCTSRPKFYLSEVESHQREYLDSVAKAGGVAALAVVFGQARTVHVIPWEEARVVKKLEAAELARYQVTEEQYLRRFVLGAHDHVQVQVQDEWDVLLVSTEVER